MSTYFRRRQNDSKHAIIALKGELDTLASEQFAKDIAPIMEDAGKDITIDFSELEFISSAGLRALLLLNKTAKTAGGKVSIEGMSEDIKQIFQMTGFDTMF